jgi:hypothetical protein
MEVVKGTSNEFIEYMFAEEWISKLLNLKLVITFSFAIYGTI